MQIRIAGVISESVVDGVSVRYTIFTQGCPRHCSGCHNKRTWDPRGGYDADTDDLIREFTSNRLISGITLSGGEPMLQPEPCLAIARAARAAGLTVWMYTGYRIEDLIVMRDSNAVIENLIRNIDVVVDGAFDMSLRSLDLPWRGSRNQNIIYLKDGKIDRIESEGIL